ncbi:MAG: ABC transporter permease [Oligoflexia bacterium]|nr:ABC transporter permease [Oligoflexia bacterium]
MLLFITKRLLKALPALLGVTLVSFLALRLVPGDPVQQLLGERGADDQTAQALRQSLGLDKALSTQYFLFLKSLSQGDLGNSIVTAEPVAKEFFSYFPATAELSFCALLWAILLGIPLGLFAAIKQNQLFDKLIIAFSLFGFSMSIFWWALMLILIFSVNLGWTPVSGRLNAIYEINSITGFYLIDAWFSADSLKVFLNSLKHLILPSLTLGTIPLAFIVRMTRSSVLETLKKDFIRTAQAKGLSFYTVLFRHAFLNALIPIITIIGFLSASLLTGAILTETIFAWPGIGQWFVGALFARDYPVITGGALLMAFIIIGINICVDVAYVQADPQIRSHWL